MCLRLLHRWLVLPVCSWQAGQLKLCQALYVGFALCCCSCQAASEVLLLNAGELDNLLKAGLWPEVHQLLCLRLAPQLFLASYSQHNLGPTEQQQQMEDKLQGLLSQLQAHSHQLALPTSRLTHPEADWRARSWAEGAGVYSTYYSLRVCIQLRATLHCISGSCLYAKICY